MAGQPDCEGVIQYLRRVGRLAASDTLQLASRMTRTGETNWKRVWFLSISYSYFKGMVEMKSSIGSTSIPHHPFQSAVQ
jgi:hypothetical protein